MNEHVDVDRFLDSETLRLAITKRARGKCEQCGVKQALGVVDPPGTARLYFVPTGEPDYEDAGCWRVLCAECRDNQVAEVPVEGQALLDFGG